MSATPEILPEKLPDSVEECHALLSEFQAILTEYASLLKTRDTELSCLQEQLKTLLRKKYGASADRIDLDNPGLFTRDALLAAMGIPEEEEQAPPETEKIAYERRKRKGHGRTEIPDHLPVEEVLVDVPDSEKICGCCGQDKIRISEERSKRLEFVPASLYVEETVRPVYACLDECEGQVVTAPVPPAPIPKGKAGPGLLAQVAVSKYSDHLPLNRQEDIFERNGVKIPRTTQCGWMRSCAELLMPVYEALRDEILACDIIASDDTHVRLQEKGKGKTKRAIVWAYGSPLRNLVAYHFRPNRNRDGPCEFLLERDNGYLQTDAYSGYSPILAASGQVAVGCWAHTRRYFVEAQGNKPTEAIEAVAKIRLLYDVERAARKQAGETGEDLYALRYRLRQEQSAPLLTDFFEWVEEKKPKALPKSGLGKALTYAENNRKELCRYLEDGRLDMDNNFIERAMRPVAVGRKNWLFMGSEQGGETWSILSSLLYTAKLQQVNPWRYMRSILKAMPTARPRDMTSLLPHHWVDPDA